MEKNSKQPAAGNKNTKQLRPLKIETLSIEDSEVQEDLNEARSLLEYLYIDVKVRSPQEVS